MHNFVISNVFVIAFVVVVVAVVVAVIDVVAVVLAIIITPGVSGLVPVVAGVQTGC